MNTSAPTKSAWRSLCLPAVTSPARTSRPMLADPARVGELSGRAAGAYHFTVKGHPPTWEGYRVAVRDPRRRRLRRDRIGRPRPYRDTADGVPDGAQCHSRLPLCRSGVSDRTRIHQEKPASARMRPPWGSRVAPPRRPPRNDCGPSTAGTGASRAGITLSTGTMTRIAVVSAPASAQKTSRACAASR